MKIYHTILLLLWFTSFSISQSLITDRPDYTESSVTVPKNAIQLESGLAYTKDNAIGIFDFPNALIRYGALSGMELRLGITGWSHITINNDQNMYFNDLLIESKIQLINKQATIPVALLMAGTLPAGNEEVSSGHSDFGFKVALSHDLSPVSGLGVNIGGFSVHNGIDRVFMGLASLSYGLTLDDRLGAYLETYIEKIETQPGNPVFDCGFTYSFVPTMQMDFYIGFGLADQSPDYIYGLGYSALF